MTEEEAKTKTCHKTLAPVASADGSAPWFSPSACIGSACMAWLSLPNHDTRVRDLWSKKKGERVMSAVGNDADWRLVNPDEPMPAPQGYCGLVGKS